MLVSLSEGTSPWFDDFTLSVKTAATGITVRDRAIKKPAIQLRTTGSGWSLSIVDIL